MLLGKQYACCVPYGYKLKSFEEATIVDAKLNKQTSKTLADNS